MISYTGYTFMKKHCQVSHLLSASLWHVVPSLMFGMRCMFMSPEENIS